jgi:hypothetical protein
MTARATSSSVADATSKGRRVRPSFTEADLRWLEARVGDILVADGVVPASCSGFSTSAAPCLFHEEAIQLDLHLPGAGRVRVSHCGCDNWLKPETPPATSLEELATDLAEEILWMWNRRSEAAGTVKKVREAFEAELARPDAQQLGLDLLGVDLGCWETYRGRRHDALATFDLQHDGLVPTSYARLYSCASGVRRFCRTVRPYQKALAERRDELAAVGATAAFDRAALAFVGKAGMDPRKIVLALARQPYGLTIQLNGGGELRLLWRMLTIRGKFEVEPGVEWDFGEVRFSREAEHVGTGRAHAGMLGEFLAFDVLPEGAKVTCVGGNAAAVILSTVPQVDLFRLTGDEVDWL